MLIHSTIDKCSEFQWTSALSSEGDDSETEYFLEMMAILRGKINMMRELVAVWNGTGCISPRQVEEKEFLERQLELGSISKVR